METVKDKELDMALDEGNRDRIGGWFGSNALPGFSDMAHIQTLDARLLPGEKKAWFRRSKRRLIIVGDVHGCKDECKYYIANLVHFGCSGLMLRSRETACTYIV